MVNAPIATRLRTYVWPALTAFAALIPFIGGFSTTNVFYVRDLGMYFWPRHLWLWQTWRNGDWPLWDPHAGGGQSAVADALNQFFLVPVTFLRLLAPPVIGFNFWIAAPFPVMAVGAWLWLRRHVSPAAAFIGAAIYALAGPVVSTGNFPNLSWAVALIPWVLWTAERVIERSDMRWISALAACVALQAVTGEPMTIAATCALVVAQATVGGAVPCWRERGLRFARVSVALVVGVLISAAQTLPLAAAASRSDRTEDIDNLLWSLHPLAFLEMVTTHLFGHVYDAPLESLPWITALNSEREPLLYSLYFGIGACVLACVGARDAATRRWRRFWWGVAGVALICACGEYSAAYPALESVVPVLQSFRFPVKYLVFGILAVAALAASGADVLLAHARNEATISRPVPAFVVLGFVGLIATLFAIVSLAQPEWMLTLWEAVARAVEIENPAEAAMWILAPSTLQWLRLAGLTIALAILLAIILYRHRFARPAASVICGLAILDPLVVNLDLHPTIPASQLGPPGWVAATREFPTDRVYVGGRIELRTDRRSRDFGLLDAPDEFALSAEWSPLAAQARISSQFAYSTAAWGVREVISYDLPKLWPREYSMMLAKFRGASRDDRLRFLRRAGVRYCFLPEPPDPRARVVVAATGLSAPMALYECQTDPRRVYITDHAITESSLRRHFDLMFDARHDPFSRVLLERSPPEAAGQPRMARSPTAARIVHESSTELVVAASVGAEGGYLNVVDSYDPSWTVEVDGRPAGLLRANGLFRAVRLAPGEHLVEFRYFPVAFYSGLVVSLLAIVGMMAFWGFHVRRRADDALRRTPVGMDEAVRHPCVRGFTLVELLIVVAVIAIIAGIAIPGLLRSRLTANEASAIGSMRALTSAQVSYAASCGGGGFAQSLSDLALATPGGVAFVDSGIATGTRTGYQFSVAPDPAATTVLPAASTCNGSTSASGYFASGLPLTVGLTGQRSFATDSRGTIYQDSTGTAIAKPIPSSTQVVQ